MKVFKYELVLNAVDESAWEQVLEMPSEPTVLSIQAHEGRTFLWAAVEPEAEKKGYKFYSVGTGFGTIPGGCYYIGTVQQGRYVWHVFSEEYLGRLLRSERYVGDSL